MTRERSCDVDRGEERPWLDPVRARHAADDKGIKGIRAVQVEYGLSRQGAVSSGVEPEHERGRMTVEQHEPIFLTQGHHSTAKSREEGIGTVI